MIYPETNQQLMMVIFDGIDNSVFKSQVLMPLLNQLDAQKNIEITLVSFEKKKHTAETLLRLIPTHDRLHVILCPRTPFMGTVGLSISKYYFKKTIETIPLEKIIARGPLAGWIVLEFIKELYQNHEQHDAIEVIIQARGLAAEEYRLINEENHTPWYHRFFSAWYYKTLQYIEYMVYHSDSFKRKYRSIDIEAVSEALKYYLIEHFEAEESMVFIAEKDLITPLTNEEQKLWRQKIRNDLAIPETAIIYCYSGSAKPWQCIEETIQYMHKKLQEDQNVWFLLLMPQKDHTYTEALLKKYIQNQEQIIIRSVPQEHLLRYLSAANYGLLLRKKDIVNWISRPTKALEYQAVGLTIIHNNTVAYVKKITCQNTL